LKTIAHLAITLFPISCRVLGAANRELNLSSDISDLYEISELLLFVSYFASQSKGIKFGGYFFDVRCAN